MDKAPLIPNPGAQHFFQMQYATGRSRIILNRFKMEDVIENENTNAILSVHSINWHHSKRGCRFFSLELPLGQHRIRHFTVCAWTRPHRIKASITLHAPNCSFLLMNFASSEPLINDIDKSYWKANSVDVYSLDYRHDDGEVKIRIFSIIRNLGEIFSLNNVANVFVLLCQETMMLRL